MKRSRPSSGSPAEEHGTFRAFVLIQTVPGRLEGICRTLRRMPPVRSVDPVTGPYDIVALIEVHHPRDLSDVVAGRIGGLRGVSRTTTLICAD